MRYIVLCFTSLLLLVMTGEFYPVQRPGIEQHLERKARIELTEMINLMAALSMAQPECGTCPSSDNSKPDLFINRDEKLIDCPKKSFYNPLSGDMKINDQLLEILGFLSQFGNENNIDWNTIVLEEISLDMEEFFSAGDLTMEPLPLNGTLSFSFGDRFFTASFTILKARTEYHLITLNSMN